MKLAIIYFWNYGIKPWWTIIINLFFYLFHINKISYVKEQKEILKKQPLKTVMKSFKWKEDSFKDWIPWIFTIIVKNLQDDCDGAAALAKWHLKENGIKSRTISIYSKNLDVGHAICVANDNTFFVSNNDIINLDSKNWKEDLFKKLDNRFSRII